MFATRRQLLQWTALCSLATGSVLAVNAYTWWDTEPEAPYKYLNALEASVVRAVCEASFPAGQELNLSGGEAQLDRFFDEVLVSMSTQNRGLLKFLLEALDRATLPTHGSHFQNLSVSDRQLCIEEWLQHSHHLVRGAIQSLVVLLGMGYTSHPKASQKLSRYFRCGFGAS